MTELDDERRLLPLMAKLPPAELAAILAEHVDADASRDALCEAVGISHRRLKELLRRERARRRDGVG